MNQLIEQETVNRLLKGINIPPQPQIMVDLQMVLIEENVNLEAVAAIITRDVGLSGCLLKVVNSSIFGLPKHVGSIAQALSLLGVNNVLNIVNSLSIRDRLSDSMIIELTGFWDNAADVAATSAAFARLTGIAPPDEAYTLGLFHNSGIPLLMNRFPIYRGVLVNAYADVNHNMTDIENAMIDCNHSVVGYYVAKSWKLPGHICEAIADHHRTEQYFIQESPCDSRKKNLLAILKLAEMVCKTYKTLGHAAKDHEFARIKKGILLFLGLSEYDLEDLLAEIGDLGLH